MFRAFLFLFKIGLLCAAIIWFAQKPGTVEVRWLGYEIEASIGFAAAVLAAALLVWTLAYRLWRLFIDAPAVLRRYRRAQIRERGYRAVTSGLVAVAAGDSGAAGKY